MNIRHPHVARAVEKTLDDVEQGVAKLADTRKLQPVDRGELLAKTFLQQDVGCPVGEIVRRFRRKMLMHFQEVMRVMVDDRAGYSP
ncbi:MAG: hypothetical protein Q7S58_16630 [Candidatus Binatus sp.]|nr:hypothetical protein [Candidatus Binatus sp.]MDO8434025.1 hypothetical protein [Candidatus Binatus sp.]